MNPYYKGAINYVRSMIDKDEARATLRKMFVYRTPLYHENPALSIRIQDLMEEYGTDNELPEGWWLNIVSSEDEVIYDVINN